MAIKGDYTLAQAAEKLGISKVATSKAAKANNWPVERVGNVNVYVAKDVLEYRDHQRRTILIKALGWRGRGLYRLDDIDVNCPVCGEFAVQWPAPPYLPTAFRCVGNHEGKLEF